MDKFVEFEAPKQDFLRVLLEHFEPTGKVTAKDTGGNIKIKTNGDEMKITLIE